VWPLLQPGQDPEGVPARVAFHLHRLGLRSTALAHVLGLSDPRYVADYVQGRADLTEQQAIQFAHLVQVPAEDLLRPLTADEAFAWRFYRISAANHRTVWQRARAAWQSSDLSMSQAATIMGFSSTYVSLALKPDGRRRILSFPPASHLANHCSFPADSLIAGLADPNPSNLQR
jgi:hypothetical protein